MIAGHFVSGLPSVEMMPNFLDGKLVFQLDETENKHDRRFDLMKSPHKEIHQQQLPWIAPATYHRFMGDWWEATCVIHT